MRLDSLTQVERRGKRTSWEEYLELIMNISEYDGIINEEKQRQQESPFALIIIMIMIMMIIMTV